MPRVKSLLLRQSVIIVSGGDVWGRVRGPDTCNTRLAVYYLYEYYAFYENFNFPRN